MPKPPKAAPMATFCERNARINMPAALPDTLTVHPSLRMIEYGTRNLARLERCNGRLDLPQRPYSCHLRREIDHALLREPDERRKILKRIGRGIERGHHLAPERKVKHD